jgi:peptidyl-prolyl cis-trans isomerase B (cyclophilin B)
MFLITSFLLFVSSIYGICYPYLNAYKNKLDATLLACFISLFVLSFSQIHGDTAVKNELQNPQVLLKTNQGNIKIELYSEKAPNTVENFLNYVRQGYYKDTIFHRVIPGFMIQGGGFTVDLKQKPTQGTIEIESDNGLKNLRGTIAMARTSDPNSASSQFFINSVDNSFLDFKSKTPSGWGYAVFGKVVSGMDVVDKISNVKTGSYAGYSDVPLEPVVIISAEEIKSAPKAENK